jgi:hypothetical protein
VTADAPARGWTPNELAQLLRVSPEKVRGWIARGELAALNVAAARCGKQRLVVLPHHLQEFEKARRAGPPPAPPRRRKRGPAVDYFPD